MGARQINISNAKVTNGDGDPVASRAFVMVRAGVGTVMVDRVTVATMPVESTVIEGGRSWRLSGPEGVWLVRKVACCGGRG